MKRLNAVGLVGLVLSTSAVWAADVKVLGSGTRKCSDWLEWKTAQNGEARAMAVEWAQGFISGHNVYARKGTETVASVVPEIKVVTTLLDAFCQKSPQSRLVEGVIDVAQSLGGAKVNFAPKMPAAPQPIKPPANRPTDL